MRHERSDGLLPTAVSNGCGPGRVWHGGGAGDRAGARLPLWIALPPALELGPSESAYPRRMSFHRRPAHVLPAATETPQVRSRLRHR